MVDLPSAVLMASEYAGIDRCGEVFFITFVLLPAIGDIPADSKGQLMLKMFPRILSVATVTLSVTVTAGSVLALLSLNFDLRTFIESAWGVATLFGGAMCLYTFFLHMTLEAVEPRALRGVDPATARELPVLLAALERRVRLLLRVGFVILTAAQLLMIRAAHGVQRVVG
jgi:hypothetical protein